MRHFYTPLELFKRYNEIANKINDFVDDVNYTIDALQAPDYFALSDSEKEWSNNAVIEELKDMRSKYIHVRFSYEHTPLFNSMSENERRLYDELI